MLTLKIVPIKMETKGGHEANITGVFPNRILVGNVSANFGGIEATWRTTGEIESVTNSSFQFLEQSGVSRSDLELINQGDVSLEELDRLCSRLFSD